MTTETFTDVELDSLAGALLWTGGLHAAIGNLLDVTRNRQDVELAQWLNFMPTEPAAEIAEATVLGLEELQSRITILIGAFSHTLDVCAERIMQEQEAAPVSDEFSRIMSAVFSEERKKNGG